VHLELDQAAIWAADHGLGVRCAYHLCG